MIIYKIKNNINEKVYIGLTTCSLEHRWKKHLTEGRNEKNKKHLYKSMRKYGLENFSIEQIDSASNLKELGLDSLDVVDLLMEMEEQFEIEFENEEMLSLKLVSDVVDTIVKKTK